jgi:hypothetical protein
MSNMGASEVSLIGKGIDRFEEQKLKKDTLDQRKNDEKKQRNLELVRLVEKETVAFHSIGFTFLHNEEGVGFFALSDAGYEKVIALIMAVGDSKPYFLSCESKTKTFASVEDLFDELGYALKTVASGGGY